MTFNLADHERPDGTYPDMKTRNGSRVTQLAYNDNISSFYHLVGFVGGSRQTFTDNGDYSHIYTAHEWDIVGLWEESPVVEDKVNTGDSEVFDPMCYLRPDNTFPTMKTRAGKEAHGLTYNESSVEYAIIGRVGSKCRSWNRRGTFYIGANEHELDLVGLWDERDALPPLNTEKSDAHTVTTTGFILRDKLAGFLMAHGVEDAVTAYKMADLMLAARRQ